MPLWLEVGGSMFKALHILVVFTTIYNLPLSICCNTKSLGYIFTIFLPIFAIVFNAYSD